MDTVIPKSSSDSPSAPRWRIGLWGAQIFLALFFGSIGILKLTSAPEALVSIGAAWAADVPLALLRFVGASELAGAFGVILPALTRILPILTPLAAAGLATIQILAIGLHAMRGELLAVLPINLVLLAISLFVVWGRIRKAPIRQR